MPVPLLITRAVEELPRNDVRSAMWEPVAAPTIEFVPAGSPEVLAAKAPNRPVLCVTTPRSVAVAARLAPGKEVYALAPRTSRELAALGFRVTGVVGGVADLIAAITPERALLLTSDLGAARAARDWPALASLVTHHTRCPACLPRTALDILADTAPFDVLLASPSAAKNLEHLAPGTLRRARRVLCHGASTLTAALAHGAHAEPFTLGE